MPTLRDYLGKLASLGADYVVKEEEFAWPSDELIDWLEWQDPARLAGQVLFIGSEETGEGALYAVVPESLLISTAPLYWIERRHHPQFRKPEIAP